MFAKEGATLKDLRTATMSVICFAGLFRAKELLNIRLCGIALHDDHIKIHIPYSKTDIYREGQDVFISRSNSNTCPGILLGRYLEHGGITLNSSKEYLFRNVIYLKSTKQDILGKRSVSYSRFLGNCSRIVWDSWGTMKLFTRFIAFAKGERLKL